MVKGREMTRGFKRFVVFALPLLLDSAPVTS